MHIHEILNEGREAPLYHGMRFGKAIWVFNNDILAAGWEHDIPGIGKVKGNSLSRNKLLRYGHIVLTLDQQKISQTNKIVPVDGEYIHYLTKNSPLAQYAKDRKPVSVYGQKRSSKHTLSEEFVIGDINPLHKYLLNVSFGEPDFGNDNPDKKEILRLIKFCQVYCTKWNIPFSK